MIGAGSHKRQAQGLVHAVVQPQVFDRYQTLVVVHGDNHIRVFLSLRTVRLHEHGVWRVRATDMHTQRLGFFNGWGNKTNLFIPKQSLFSCMGVKPCDSHARNSSMDIPPAVMRDLESFKKIVKVDQANGFAQRHMDADQNHPQPWARQHHANRQTTDRQAQVLRGQ